jgi:hypothetical protein
MNIIAKHDGQAMVASCAPQYVQCDVAVEVAAPHIGQFIVAASIVVILATIWPQRVWFEN